MILLKDLWLEASQKPLPSSTISPDPLTSQRTLSINLSKLMANLVSISTAELILSHMVEQPAAVSEFVTFCFQKWINLLLLGLVSLSLDQPVTMAMTVTTSNITFIGKTLSNHEPSPAYLRLSPNWTV